MSLSEQVRRRLRLYLPLIKSLQTGLLLVTALAGYGSAHCPVIHWPDTLALLGSLFLAISGSTVLNMVFDKDIDACMRRTLRRPLPNGALPTREALVLGLLLSAGGLAGSFAIGPLYGAVVAAGLFLDVVVYTMWLKRRTPYAIILGGLSGGMPALAGRVLATGQIDGIGILLALAVLCWIPTHIMTFSMRYSEDYRRAGVPTFPSSYGLPATRLLIAGSALAAAVLMESTAYLIGMSWPHLQVLLVLGAGLLALALVSVLRPSERLNFGLFKYASVYMFGSMLLMVAEAF